MTVWKRLNRVGKQEKREGQAQKGDANQKLGEKQKRTKGSRQLGKENKRGIKWSRQRTTGKKSERERGWLIPQKSAIEDVINGNGSDNHFDGGLAYVSRWIIPGRRIRRKGRIVKTNRRET